MTRQYKNPPLIEAVCEFRFQSESPWDPAIPGLVYAELRDEFPVRLPSRSGSIEATLVITERGIQQQRMNQQEEVRFWRDHNTGVIRIAPNTLSISHYDPYPSWQKFKPTIIKVLDTYKKVANPRGFQRIGLRYINQVVFGESSVDLQQYFDFYPLVGKRLPQDYVSFMTGIQAVFNDERDVLRLQISNGTGSSEGTLPILLDLDYFLRVPGAVTFDRVDDWLEEAHTRVEEAFEGCLKDELRKRFDEVGK